MFPDRPEAIPSDPISCEKVPADRAHNLLVRSLWYQLRAAFPDEFDSHSSIDVALRCKLSKEDILLLRRFVENNPDFPIPSVDTINGIFSRFLEPLPEKTESPSFNIPYEYALIFIFFLIYRKVGAILSILIAILCFAAYEVYIRAIARRQALLNRLPSIPEHCLPYSQQSLMTRLLNFAPFGSSQNECVEYFQILMTTPYVDLRPDRIFLYVLGEAVESIFATLGGSLGQFYNKLNRWVSFYVAIPLTLVFIYYLFRVLTAPRKSKKRHGAKRRGALPLKQEKCQSLTNEN